MITCSVRTERWVRHMDDDNAVREMHAGLAMVGLLMRGVENYDIPSLAYQLADAMIIASKEPTPEVGIAAVKRRRKPL